MKSKVTFSLGKKLTVLTILLSVTLSLAAIFVSYRVFSSTMTDYYVRLGTNLVSTLASQLDADELERYYIAATDFEAVDLVTDALREKILKKYHPSVG